MQTTIAAEMAQFYQYVKANNLGGTTLPNGETLTQALKGLTAQFQAERQNNLNSGGKKGIVNYGDEYTAAQNQIIALEKAAGITLP